MTVTCLVVDDSATVRLLIRSILESDPEMRVIGEARNGREAIALCLRLVPDIVTMDIHMPGMDGFEAIRHIMNESPRPIIVLTGLESSQLLEISFKALALGALTVLAKPRGSSLRDPEALHLLQQAKIMAAVKVIRRPLWLKPKMAGGDEPARAGPARGQALSSGLRLVRRIVAIGVSTGGPPALQVILGSLPADFPLPIVIVQHISPGFVSGLANWLSSTTPLRCNVAEHGEALKPGVAYLAPDDRHLTVSGSGCAWMEASPPVDGHCPSATALFDSIARAYGCAAIGVILTGMGQDGARGLRAMRQAGAHTIAQDEASSVVFGMPKAALELDAAVEQLPLDHIAGRLLSVMEPRREAR